MYVSLKEIEELQSDNVYIQDKEYVEKTLNDIIADGANNLQVVTDFDFTITKHTLPNGQPTLSSFGLFEHCPSVPESYKQKSLDMLHYYKPIEIDPAVPLETKHKYMVEWWTKTSELLKDFAFHEPDLVHMANQYKESFRDNAKDMFKTLYDRNIPCLVFSAGLGNSVNAMLDAANVHYSNIRVVSNFLKITNGLVDGFIGKIIHVMNKNEASIKDTEYYSLIQDRENVILMGDSLGDACMADGISHKKKLKIGFLCNNIEQSLPNYKNNFDIVVVNDQTMNIPNSIINLCN
uniref:5'-nucleotidase n=1 Tax=Xenopsylla cheopis TaxID=163159 RepID=A0A6M2DDT7_XENCH